MRQAALAIMQAIPHPLAKVCSDAILSNNLSRLPAVRPGDFDDPKAYLEAAQVPALVKKLRGLVPDQGAELRRKAEEVFLLCERQCAQTNARMAYYINLMERPYIEDENDDRMYAYLRRAKGIIKRILGPVPKALGRPVFSGGSSFLNRASAKSLPHKLGGRSAVTPDLYSVLHLLESQNAPRWTDLRAEYGTEIIFGNRFTTVPKDSEKDRGICVEPLCNLAWQLAAGRIIRRRLESEVVVIDSFSPSQGQQLHRFLARIGSCEGTLATGDQSNASDTVARDLVRLLLPKDWYDLLNTLRSHYTLFRGEWVKLEKFSSMGNGFTFELETLLFYALIRALREDAIISVYGDDLIYESDMAEDVGACLSFFGFTPNEKKSYSTGVFRESCGGDYFNGHPVRPIYLKGDGRTPADWFIIINQLGRVSTNLNWGLEPLIHRLIEEHVPKWARLYGPVTRDACPNWIETDERSFWRTRGADGLLFVRGLDPEYGRSYRKWLNKSEALWCALLGCSSDGVQAATEPIGFKPRWFSAS